VNYGFINGVKNLLEELDTIIGDGSKYGNQKVQKA
jgi:hypothetical protein